MFERVVYPDIPGAMAPVLMQEVWTYVQLSDRVGVCMWDYLSGAGISPVARDVRWAEYSPARPYSAIFGQSLFGNNQSNFLYI